METPHACGNMAKCQNVNSSTARGETGAQMVLANTYHLHLQPSEAIVAKAGGLHSLWGEGTISALIRAVFRF